MLAIFSLKIEPGAQDLPVHLGAVSQPWEETAVQLAGRVMHPPQQDAADAPAAAAGCEGQDGFKGVAPGQIGGTSCSRAAAKQRCPESQGVSQ